MTSTPDPKTVVSSNPFQARLDKLAKMREQSIDPYPPRFHVTHKASELHDRYSNLEPEAVTQDTVVVAGRLMSSRNSGMFRDLLDGTGKIQIFSHKANTEPESLALKSLIDIGDYIGVRGVVRRTKAGELTINAQQITVLTKSLRPPPEKHHGVTDAETRQRNRTLDLIANESSRETFRMRSRAITQIRRMMTNDEGFLEIETPMLHSVYGGATADPFMTHYNAVEQDMYLRIALELHLKRTLAGGLHDKLFEVGRVFRNEGVSTRHNPEFTMLEAYWAYSDYSDIMGLVGRMFESVAQHLHGTSTVIFGDAKISFKGPYPRLPMPKAVKDASGVDFLEMESANAAREAVKNLGIEIDDDATWGECLETTFGERVEETLIQPTHVTHYPKDTSPLAKALPEDPRLVARFETYGNGWELANAFTELNDPIE